MRGGAARSALLSKADEIFDILHRAHRNLSMASDVFDNLHGVLDELAPEEVDVAQDLADLDGKPNLKKRRRTNSKGNTLQEKRSAVVGRKQQGTR